jgi:hypothetical protein
MMKNDLHYTIPDDNGVRICNLAVRELCHEAVKFADLVASKGYALLPQSSACFSAFTPYQVASHTISLACLRRTNQIYALKYFITYFLTDPKKTRPPNQMS